MIDIESQVFDTVYKALVEAYPDIFVSSSAVASAAVFPAVSVLEASNVTETNTLTSSLHENHARVMYEINVYSNISQGRKAQAKSISNLIDEIMIGMGFTRSMSQPVPNYADGTVYRIHMRYTAVVGKDNTIYRGGR